MRYEIQGGMLPSVDVFLEAGESVYTESGGMAWMKGDIDMSTNTRGGLLKGLGRKLAGESLFMTTYACRRGEPRSPLPRKRRAPSSPWNWTPARASSPKRTPLWPPRKVWRSRCTFASG